MVGRDKNGKTIYSIGNDIKRRSFPGAYGSSANRRRSWSGAPSSNSIRENREKYNSNTNQNNKWTSERIAQLDNAVKKSGVNIIIEDIFRGGTEEMNGFLARNYTAAREITDTMKNIIDSVKIRFGVEPSSVYGRAVRSFEKALAKRETGGESGIQFSQKINEYPYDMQKIIEGCLENVNKDIVSFAERVQRGEADSKEKLYLDTVSERAAEDIQRLLGIDVRGYRTSLDVNAVMHIKKRHGVSGIADSSMSNTLDLARIE